MYYGYYMSYFSMQTQYHFKLPDEGKGDLRVFNGYKCPLTITMLPETKEKLKFEIDELGFYVLRNRLATKSYPYIAESQCAKNIVKGNFVITSQIEASYYFKDAENQENQTIMKYFEDHTNHSGLHSKIRILLNTPRQVRVRLKSFRRSRKSDEQLLTNNSFALIDIQWAAIPQIYELAIEGSPIFEMKFEAGGVYTIMLIPFKGTLNYVRVYILLSSTVAIWQNST